MTGSGGCPACADTAERRQHLDVLFAAITEIGTQPAARVAQLAQVIQHGLEAIGEACELGPMEVYAGMMPPGQVAALDQAKAAIAGRLGLNGPCWLCGQGD